MRRDLGKTLGKEEKKRRRSFSNSGVLSRKGGKNFIWEGREKKGSVEPSSSGGKPTSHITKKGQEKAGLWNFPKKGKKKELFLSCKALAVEGKLLDERPIAPGKGRGSSGFRPWKGCQL